MSYTCLYACVCRPVLDWYQGCKLMWKRARSCCIARVLNVWNLGLFSSFLWMIVTVMSPRDAASESGAIFYSAGLVEPAMKQNSVAELTNQRRFAIHFQVENARRPSVLERWRPTMERSRHRTSRISITTTPTANGCWRQQRNRSAGMFVTCRLCYILAQQNAISRCIIGDGS
jgi:hypothetical protein